MNNLFTSSSDMNNQKSFITLVLRLALVSTPALVWFVWQLSLPLNQYTFRAWEALVVHGDYWNGNFFPNQRLDSTEMGDLGPYTEDSVPKRTRWETDQDGYRNSNDSCQEPEGIVIGDSTAAGASLSQDETLTALLSKGRCVRSFAGSNFRFDVEHAYNLGYRPKWILISVGDYVALPLAQIVDRFRAADVKPGSESVIPFPRLLTAYSRIRKNPYWNFRESHGLHSALFRSFTPPDEFMGTYPFGTQPRQLFDEASAFRQPDSWSDEELEEIVLSLDRFGGELQKLGSRLYLSLMPRKNILYPKLSGEAPGRFGERFPEFLEKVRNRRGSLRFEYVNTIRAFKDHFERTGQFLHQSDDTHWNPLGVSLVVSEVEKRLEQDAAAVGSPRNGDQ